MYLKRVIFPVLTAFIGLYLSSCKDQTTNHVQQVPEAKKYTLKYAQCDEQSKTVILDFQRTIGDWSTLLEKKDMQQTYISSEPGKGSDVSVERYVFDGGLSYAKYSQRDMLFSEREGELIQLYKDQTPSMSFGGKPEQDPEILKWATFLREANYFWATFHYRLDEPAIIYNYLGEEEVDGKQYQKVEMSYNPKITNKEFNDSFELFFNKKTHLLDFFHQNLPSFQVNERNIKTIFEYTVVDDIYVIKTSKRHIMSESGELTHVATLTAKDVSFNNGFKKADFDLTKEQ